MRLKQQKARFKASVGINSAIMAGAVLGRLSPAATAFLHNGATIGILLRALSSDAHAHPAAPGRSKSLTASLKDE